MESISSRVQSIIKNALNRALPRSEKTSDTQKLYALVQELMVLAAASGRLTARINAWQDRDTDLELEKMFIQVMKSYHDDLMEKLSKEDEDG